MNIDNYPSKNSQSLRKAVGQHLAYLGQSNPNLVVLDAEVGNSTFTNIFGEQFPERFFQSFIAEQNMISMALGLSIAGKIPVASTFGAFLSRAFDQIRMCQYSAPKSNVKIIGTHCGVHIGEDGPSQMALEDIAMFRTIMDSVIMYPSDSLSAQKQLELIIGHKTAVSYLRVTRGELPEIYEKSDEFVIGGSQTLIQSDSDQVTLVGAGVTLHQAIKAAIELKKQGIDCRVIDLYSIKPLDLPTLQKAYQQTKSLIVIEDHYLAGGIYEAICGAGIGFKPTHSLHVSKTPKSGTPEELLQFAEIDTGAIIRKVKEVL